MDFDLTDEQSATAEAAAKLLLDKSSPERIRVVERAGDVVFDRELWRAMAEAGLLGIAVPDGQGGAGLTILEAALVLQEVGRRTAPVPALAGIGFATPTLAAYGSPAQKAAVLPGVADGTIVATGAFVEYLGDPTSPSTTAATGVDGGGGWTLTGVKTNVPAALVADTILVSASTQDGRTGVFLLNPAGAGVTLAAQATTAATPDAELTLSGAPAEAVGPVDTDGTVLRHALEHATVAVCAVMAGLTAEAVRLTGEYTASREQFGRPIATFQAVGQRAADAYVDSKAIELTMLQAAWRISAGAPADREVAVAKYWAAEGGQRIARAAAHLHGGVGVDRDYPLHRYFLLAKQLELMLGGANRQLVALGRILAAEGSHRPDQLLT
ncbi:MAG: acyl-CoA dehydrogenase family protein [Acidimicrobiales bacterium]